MAEQMRTDASAVVKPSRDNAMERLKRKTSGGEKGWENTERKGETLQ